QQQLTSLEEIGSASNVRPAAIQAQFLRNILIRVPAYRQSLDEVKTPVTSAGEPFLKFLRLPSPTSEPSAADAHLQFKSHDFSSAPENSVTWIGTFVPDEKHDAEVIWADTSSVHLRNGVSLLLPGPLTSSKSTLPEHAVMAADLNYDFKTDLTIATDRGIRFYQQSSLDRFINVTERTKLPSTILNGSYTGLWAFDIDLDGDLDIVLGVPNGEPLVLRNNGDGTYAEIRPFKGIDGLFGFVGADVDGDGDADVALLDRNGTLKVFANERLGDYRPRELPTELKGRYISLVAADVNGDGLPDFTVLRSDYHVFRLSDRSAGRDWTTGELVAAKVPAIVPASPSLALIDLDNNGSLDLVVDDQVYLSDGRGFSTSPCQLPAVGRGFLDLNGDGRLDIIGYKKDRTPLELINYGSKQYNWQTIRTKAAATTGDQRINSFGIGGEIEIRAELLTQKQIIGSPLLHFGLGDHGQAQFARIAWPNGLIQTEFSPKADETLVAEQRLKGSCPLLFAWDGTAMKFLKDVAPMAAALGAHDTSGGLAKVSQTEEWFKIAGDQLQARGGFYDLRVTDEYWETYYIDHYSMLAVDHPAGTHIFADERVAGSQVPLKIYLTGATRSFSVVKDDRGRDAAATVRNLDGQYLSTFERGEYQGIARDHWVELELPHDAPHDGPLYLIAQGWLHPWDDGILVAVNQGAQAKPEDLSIEVPDRNGKWCKVRRNLGVPAGREKTVVLDLAGVFLPGAPRKLRLRTNLEIYWDKLSWASGLSDELLRTQPLHLSQAEIMHRGFSRIRQENSSAPEIPQYADVVESGNKWQGIEGYYTRYGDVLPLLEKIDDRFVIAGSGDELRMKFAVPKGSLAGFSRDFIFVGDGWMKEGDYSFKYSTTVLPMPTHATKNYLLPLTELEDDAAYRLHPRDWQEFHTRYVSGRNLATALWSK
ncbi:MAG: CRTAC1 family protein, partial [Acidobacteriota bacterium]|nr:CRTAC1 family protein [Acidobacteriota bacterium]